MWHYLHCLAVNWHLSPWIKKYQYCCRHWWVHVNNVFINVQSRFVYQKGALLGNYHSWTVQLNSPVIFILQLVCLLISPCAVFLIFFIFQNSLTTTSKISKASKSKRGLDRMKLIETIHFSLFLFLSFCFFDSIYGCQTGCMTLLLPWSHGSSVGSHVQYRVYTLKMII